MNTIKIYAHNSNMMMMMTIQRETDTIYLSDETLQYFHIISPTPPLNTLLNYLSKPYKEMTITHTHIERV